MTLHLSSDQAMLIHLRLKGGIVGVRQSGPGIHRPLWLIDLGRGGELVYVATASAEGDYSFEVTSFERERPAEMSVETGTAVRLDQRLANLQEAEDLLANAELLRRHWPGAPTGQSATDLYDRALGSAQTLKDIPLQCLILTQKARYLAFGGKSYTDAETLLEQAVAMPNAQAAAQQALAWKTLSSVRYDLGDYQRAIDAGQTALRLYQQNGDVYWQGIVLGNLASVYAELGETANAVATGRKALDDAEQTRDIAGVVYCLSQLANLYQEQGDLEGARRTFEDGLRWVSHIPYAPLVEAEIQKDIGNFYAQIGNWNDARLALRRCLTLEGTQSDPVALEAQGLLAQVMFHKGALAVAVAEDTRAIAIAHRLALKQDEAELLLRRASIELALHRQTQATADIQAAEELSNKLPSLPLKIEIEAALGDALVTDHPREAAEAYRRALQLAERCSEGEEQSRALAGLAKALDREGDWQEAASRIEAALKILETSRGNLSAREEKVTYFAMHRRWYELAVDICMELDQRYPAKGYRELAFNYTERARARVLLDTLETSGYTTSLPAADELREQYARNQREMAEQRASLDSADVSTLSAAAVRVERLHSEGDHLSAQMQSADPRLKSLSPSQSATSTQIQENLIADHTILISYWIGDSHSYRWLLTKDGLSVQFLPSRTKLARIVLPLEKDLQSRRPVPLPGEDVAAYSMREQKISLQLQRNLDRVGYLLLSRIPARTKSILMVGDDCLMPLPFAALRLRSGSRTDYALRKYNFLQEPSASVALYLKQHPVERQILHITIFADPVYSASDPRLATTNRKAYTEADMTGLPRLTSSLDESRSISHDLPSEAVTLRTGFDASPENVQTLSSENAVILHFATHTVMLENRPEASGIALSVLDRKGERQAGTLWLKDIYSLHLPSALVVLSGCGTDRKDIDNGEMLHNLSYAFFFAGAHSVIGSLWRVDDAATAHMMSIFYREMLKEHQLTGDALRDAQLRMLADPQTSSPAIWASFVLEGWPASPGSLQHLDATAALADTTVGRHL